MGTINYGTSNYITIGYEPLCAYDLERDPGFMEELQEEVDEYGGTLENAMQDYITGTEEDSYLNIEHILKKYDFHFFHVVIKSGYYEGFYIDIENNFGYCYDDSGEKRQAQKEITQLKAFLLECVENGLCQVFPGWCTSYKDRKTSLQGIAAAIRELRSECRAIPTWYKLQLAGKEGTKNDKARNL